MNHSIIQDQSDINSFYTKIYSIVGVGIGISAIVSLLMLFVFQDAIYTILTRSVWVIRTGSSTARTIATCSSCQSRFPSAFDFTST